MAPCEILLGIKPRFAVESSDELPGKELLANSLPYEQELALMNRAKPFVPRTDKKEVRYQIAEMVLLRGSKQTKGPKFQASMWVGPFKVAFTPHPPSELENASGRRSRKPV